MRWPFKRKTETPKQSLRTFYAAGVGRLMSSLPTSSQSVDYDLHQSLEILRARARGLCQNNDYAVKYLNMVESNVVGGNGFNIQIHVKETDAKGNEKDDKMASDAIEKAFARWSKVGNCEVTGKMSFVDVQNLYIRTVVRDGEVLIRKVFDKRYEFGFKLQFLDTDRLDIKKNEVLGNGNVIKMGVELNSAGEPVAYWIRTKHPGDNPYYTNTAGNVFERVEAKYIYHHFTSDRPEQTRGLPWMHSAITRLYNLAGYEEAAIVAARIGAAKMGHYITPEGDGNALADSKTDDGQLLTDAEAGVFQILPPGYDFKSFDPDYPHAMFAEFVKSTLRGVASGIGVSYNTLSNDLEGVNFSSIRTGVLEERDNWKTIQKWMIDQFLTDVFETWLQFALLKSAIKMPNGSALPSYKYDKFNAATWQGRRWEWVDPRADIEANIAAINNGLKSRADVIAEQGRDIDDVFAALKDEQEKISEMGIEVAGANPNAAAAQAVNNDQSQGVA